MAFDRPIKSESASFSAFGKKLRMLLLGRTDFLTGVAAGFDAFFPGVAVVRFRDVEVGPMAAVKRRGCRLNKESRRKRKR